MSFSTSFFGTDRIAFIASRNRSYGIGSRALMLYSFQPRRNMSMTRDDLVELLRHDRGIREIVLDLIEQSLRAVGWE